MRRVWSDEEKRVISARSLGNRVGTWIVQAGLAGANGNPDRSRRGIRKGVADLMARSGATDNKHVVVFGWAESTPASAYTKKVERSRMDAAAVETARSRGGWTTTVGPRSGYGRKARKFKG